MLVTFPSPSSDLLTGCYLGAGTTEALAWRDRRTDDCLRTLEFIRSIYDPRLRENRASKVHNVSLLPRTKRSIPQRDDVRHLSGIANPIPAVKDNTNKVIEWCRWHVSYDAQLRTLGRRGEPTPLNLESRSAAIRSVVPAVRICRKSEFQSGRYQPFSVVPSRTIGGATDVAPSQLVGRIRMKLEKFEHVKVHEVHTPF
jgi:hypothetical protein